MTVEKQLKIENIYMPHIKKTSCQRDLAFCYTSKSHISYYIYDNIKKLDIKVRYMTMYVKRIDTYETECTNHNLY